MVRFFGNNTFDIASLFRWLRVVDPAGHYGNSWKNLFPITRHKVQGVVVCYNDTIELYLGIFIGIRMGKGFEKCFSEKIFCIHEFNAELRGRGNIFKGLRDPLMQPLRPPEVHGIGV